jgi:ATP-dependent DNA helicase RecG
MTEENQTFDKKSLKLFVTNSNNIDWDGLALDAVAFATSQGGFIFVGIEDKNQLPPKNQKIDSSILPKIRKNITNLTERVALGQVEIKVAQNNGEFISIQILPSTQTLPCTTKGVYAYRFEDETKRLTDPQDLVHLLNEKNSFNWESNDTKLILDTKKSENLIKKIRNSNRVDDFIKQKSDLEILSYYKLVSENNTLTNLGVLWLGNDHQRSKICYPLRIQFTKYDAQGKYTKRKLWTDLTKDPVEILDEIMKLPEWQEGIEISDGIYRNMILFYPTEVIKELLANAISHRSYTLNGDIFVNFYPDRLEVVSPGSLPFGVTPENILHVSKPRNQYFCELARDIYFMEKMGSGYDQIYQLLLEDGKKLPHVESQPDSVKVTVFNQITNPNIINLMNKISEENQLGQKSFITLGIIAQEQSITAFELGKLLQVKNYDLNHYWLDELLQKDLIKTSGDKKGKKYKINPKLLKSLGFKGKTSLKTMEDHRLRALIEEDLKIYGKSSIGEIIQRIGKELKKNHVRTQLEILMANATIEKQGVQKGTKYFLKKT